MSDYVENHLISDEFVIKKSMYSWWNVIPWVVMFIFCNLLGVIFLWKHITILLICLSLLLVVFLMIMVPLLLNKANVVLGVTNKRVLGKGKYHRFEFASYKSIDIPLHEILDVTTEFGVFGEFLGFGNICVVTENKTEMPESLAFMEKDSRLFNESIEVTFVGLMRPNELKNEIMKTIVKPKACKNEIMKVVGEYLDLMSKTLKKDITMIIEKYLEKELKPNDLENEIATLIENYPREKLNELKNGIMTIVEKYQEEEQVSN